MSNGIVEKALSSLGKGFDLTSDFRLKFCKGKERLVLLNEAETRELLVPGFGAIADVPVDIKCDKGDRTRYQSDILEFNQMSEFFNQKSSIPGKIPSGFFNSVFGFEGSSWAKDASNTKYLGIDGYFIILFNARIDRYPLILSDEVRDAVPSTWDPSGLARFIETYGTHIIVGLSVGGQDMILVRQDKSSKVGPSDLKNHLDELGDQLFTGACNFSSKSKDQKHKVPHAFNVFDPQVATFNSYSSVTSKDGINVVCFKRGGDLSSDSHAEWLLTVPSIPDAVHFCFIPITSLLKDVPGKGFLSHAINLYLRYKPPISELACFIDFQSHKIWAPIHNEFPLGPTSNMSNSWTSLQFNLMGPKLYVNSSQVTVGKRPVTGMRLYLEGKKCNRLAIHLQHLSNTPTMLEDKIIDDLPLWQSSEFVENEKFFEAVSGKMFSHVCTSPVKYNPNWATTSLANDEAYIVTGVQLHVKKHNSKKVLHLRLLFSKVQDACIVKSNWAQGPSGYSQRSGIFSAFSNSAGINLRNNNNLKEIPPRLVVVDSSVFPGGPPVPVQAQKLLKYVDTSQVYRGPQDCPGHWLVTGAKLNLENGKIFLHVKFSLLSYACSSSSP